MSDHQMAKNLAEGIRQLDIDLHDGAQQQMLDYVQLLHKWNRIYNLTAVRDPVQMISHHLLDSLAVLPHLHGERIADIGSGAGLPGIVLAICRPQGNFLLIDSNSKKTRFLVQAVATLSLDNVQIHHGKAQSYPAEPGFDTVVCRALASLPALIEMATNLLDTNGVLVAQKGRYPEDELAQIPDDWQATCVAIQVPFLETKERHIVSVTRR